MAAITFIGAVVAVSASTPATEDASGFAALTYTTVGNVISLGETGDESDNVTVPLLSGRTLQVNGAKTGGTKTLTWQYEVADAGQVILRAQSNSATTVSVKITDPDGKIEYFHCRVANVKRTERSSSQYKGETAELRVNSATITV